MMDFNSSTDSYYYTFASDQSAELYKDNLPNDFKVYAGRWPLTFLSGSYEVALHDLGYELFKNARKVEPAFVFTDLCSADDNLFGMGCQGSQILRGIGLEKGQRWHTVSVPQYKDVAPGRFDVIRVWITHPDLKPFSKFPESAVTRCVLHFRKKTNF